MKKIEYVSPEVEIVELTEQDGLLDTISGDFSGEPGTGRAPQDSRRTNFDDEN